MEPDTQDMRDQCIYVVQLYIITTYKVLPAQLRSLKFLLPNLIMGKDEVDRYFMFLVLCKSKLARK